ncbi:hypothetical protein FRC12_024597 [Ceratobasidium sp. 428]|nr:hypothetical protein FRC12_024597 [Ceratobasidium sp. 428]
MDQLKGLFAASKKSQHGRVESEGSLDIPNHRNRWSWRSRTPSPTSSTRGSQRPQSREPTPPRSQPQPQPDADVPTAVAQPVDPPSPPRRSSLEVPTIVTPDPQPNVSNNSTRSPSPSPLPSPEDGQKGLLDLSAQCTLPLATVTAELAVIPGIREVVDCLTAVFQAIEKSRVNKEQWKLLQGRCVMVARIAGAQVTNHGGEQYPGLRHATEILTQTINQIVERANYWSQMPDLIAYVQFNIISEEIREHFTVLDSCLNLFSCATSVAQMQWIREFEAAQKNELARLENLRVIVASMDDKLELLAQTQNTVRDTNLQTQDTVVQTQDLMRQCHELIQRLFDQKILHNQSTVLAETHADAQRTIQTILTVTNIQLPPQLLVGRQCVPDAAVPVKAGPTCDVYSASFLTNEKVAKKVFRIGTSEKEYTERYATRLVRDAKLWATFRSPYTLPFYGVGMEAFEGGQHFQLYMVSPWMKNFDAVTYLKLHRNNPNMKEGIMRIITDAAKGLQYFHGIEPPVVHSGMRGDNILITDSGGGVLGGFGLTKALENSTAGEKIPVAVMTGKTESQRWMAPEMFSDDPPELHPPSDIWGWAMAALELITGRIPYYEHKRTHSVVFEVQKNKRPTRAKYPDFEKYALKPDEMWNLLERCWQTNPEDRPTIDEVVAELEEMRGKKGAKGRS